MLTMLSIGILAIFPLLFILFDEEQLKKHRYVLLLPLLVNILAGTIWFFQLQTGPIEHHFQWITILNIETIFRVDWFSWYFFMLINVIGLMVFLYASAYMKSYDGYKRFFTFLYIFTAAMNGIVLAGDLITLFVFWELTSICSFLLIGFNHREANSRNASLTALLITAAGGLALLTAVIWLGNLAGSYDIQKVLNLSNALHRDSLIIIFILIIIGAFTKSAQFPFHFWLPGAMQAPTPVSAFLHSATMVKAGIYLLFRFTPMMGEMVHWYYVLSLTGVITMLLGSFSALFQSDLKKILAYTTISALGTIVMLIGIDTKMSIKAALVFLLVHALYKASLFMLTGVIDKIKGTRELKEIGNLWKSNPVICIVAILSLLSMAGLPPMLGFIGKEVMYDAKFQAPGIARLMLLLSVISNAFMVFISIKLMVLLFLPNGNQPSSHSSKSKPAMMAGPVAFTIIAFVFGLAPYSLSDFFGNILSQITFTPVQIQLKMWHGFNVVFVLSLATILLGLLLWIFENRITGLFLKIYRNLFTINLTHSFQHIIQYFLKFTKIQTNRIQHGVHRYYLMIIFLFSIAYIWWKLLMTGLYVPTFNTENVSLLTVVVTSIMLLTVGLIVTTRSRVVAVVALALIGYGIALLFMTYGAIDLAITQIIADTLTMIIFVIVLQKLPRFARLSSKRSRMRDALIALSVGLSITLLILKADMVNIHQPVSDYFVENSLTKGKGQNIVNVILVDFRSLDTLGEITVLAVAAIGIATMLSFTLNKKSHG
ncbi:MAG: DUF4040 domain-containing protein [Bacteroidetes bacterium]|jgi:multicomponent Na+:H+ antiporter subunit A|nr:DUF4040 domain-containing protein [Bacteroidota bacterium]